MINLEASHIVPSFKEFENKLNKLLELWENYVSNDFSSYYANEAIEAKEDLIKLVKNNLKENN